MSVSLRDRARALGICALFLSGSFLWSAWWEGASGYGDNFRAMSEGRFLGNPMAIRPLMPGIAYVLGLGGGYYPLFSLLVVLCFLWVVFEWCRREYDDPQTATLIVGILAFLPVVQFQLVHVGWADPMLYLIIMLALMWGQLLPLWIVLGVLAHESFLFLVPALFLYHRLLRGQQGMRLRWIVLAVAGVLILRRQLRVIWQCEAYPIWSYVRPILADPLVEWRGQPIGSALWASYEVAGLALLVGIAYAARSGTEHRKALALVLVTAAAVVGQLMVAHDTTRLMSNGFFVVLLIPTLLRGLKGSKVILAVALAGCIAVPSFYVGGDWSYDLEQDHTKLRTLLAGIDPDPSNHVDEKGIGSDD